MPELPEVEITKNKLLVLVGKTIAGFKTDWPRGLKSSKTPQGVARDIAGVKIIGLSRKGKALFFELSNNQELGFHQRMSGSLKIVKNGERNYPKSLRVRVPFTDGSELWFIDPRKFGVVWYGGKEYLLNDSYVGHLGPDALDISKKEFITLLKNRRGMVKPLLLNQIIIAGIGNIIADETLWDARVNPIIRVENLSDKNLAKIHGSLQKILRRALKAGGSSIRDWIDPGGTRGGFQKVMRVYGKKNVPCARCRSPIIRKVVGGRGTWVCVNCQR